MCATAVVPELPGLMSAQVLLSPAIDSSERPRTGVECIHTANVADAYSRNSHELSLRRSSHAYAIRRRDRRPRERVPHLYRLRLTRLASVLVASRRPCGGIDACAG